MRFSVIIPVYNAEEYLEKCLDSVQPALCPEDEIILSLGDSADRSGEIAARYAARRSNIRIVKQRGRGLSDARNCAVAAAAGDYILCVDSDDYVEPSLLSGFLARIRGGEWDEEVIYHDFRRLERRSGKLVDMFQIGPGVEAEGLSYLPRMLRRRQCFWNVWRYVCKREFLERNGIRYIDNVLSEDVAYTTDILLARPTIRFTHAPFYVYTVGKGGSLMDRASYRRLADTVRVLRDSVEKLRGSDFPERSCVMAQYQFEYLLNMALIHEVDRQDRGTSEELFSDWPQVLADSSDWLVRASRGVLRLSGVRMFAWGLHKLKLVRRLARRMRGRRER